MSLITNIDHIARQPGVLAVFVDGDPPAFRGDPLLREACRLAILLRAEASADSVGVTLSTPETSSARSRTIYVQREPGGTAARLAGPGLD